jgi:hypothetical protein
MGARVFAVATKVARDSVRSRWLWKPRLRVPYTNTTCLRADPEGEAAEADIEIDRIVADDIGARDVRARVRASGGRFEEPGRIQHACVRSADVARRRDSI